MESFPRSRIARRLWSVVNVGVFLGAVYFVATGYRELHHWLLVLGTFSNVMVDLSLRRARDR